jgi:GNAT superfamily N-acetyltransferase
MKDEAYLLKIEDATNSSFKDVPSSCRYCLYWQTSGAYGEEMLKPEMEQQKREWFNKVSSEFGNCIKIAYLANKPIGFIQYAPAKFFPRIKEYVAGPPSEDVVFLACLYVDSKEARGKGFGTALLKNLLAELKQRKSKAVETFARKSSSDNPSGPLAFYLRHGFNIIRDKNDFPLVRFEF